MSLRTTIDLAELSWGDLIAFADLGRAVGKRDEDLVEQVPSQHDADEADSFVVELPHGEVRVPPVFSPEDVRRFTEALDHVVEQDGDARAVLGVLQELRNLLAVR